MAEAEDRGQFRGSATWAKGYGNALHRCGLFWELVEIAQPANPKSDYELTEDDFVEWCLRFITVNPHGRQKLGDHSHIPLLLAAFRKAVSDHSDGNWHGRPPKLHYEYLARRIELTPEWTKKIAAKLGLDPPEMAGKSIGDDAKDTASGQKRESSKTASSTTTTWRYRGIDPATCHKVQSLPIYCYWCAQEGHYGGDCLLNPRKHSADHVWTMRHAKMFIDTTSSELCIEAQAQPVNRDTLEEQVRKEMLAQALDQERLAIRESKHRKKEKQKRLENQGANKAKRQANKQPNNEQAKPKTDKQTNKQVNKQPSKKSDKQPNKQSKNQEGKQVQRHNSVQSSGQNGNNSAVCISAGPQTSQKRSKSKNRGGPKAQSKNRHSRRKKGGQSGNSSNKGASYNKAAS